MPSPSLERLAAKYRALAELRARREEAQAQGLPSFAGEEAQARRATFHALAQEFPGSLRELDVTPAATLRTRAEALERGEAPRWAEVAVAYHASLREALAIKRWLAERLPRGGAVSPALAAEFQRWYATQPFARPGAHPATVEHLQKHLHPPGGRVQVLVWLELEQQFGLPRAELEAELFGRAYGAT